MRQRQYPACAPTSALPIAGIVERTDALFERLDDPRRDLAVKLAQFLRRLPQKTLS